MAEGKKLHGSDSAWDVANNATEHASDMTAPLRHVPLGAATGDSIGWDGSKWVVLPKGTQYQVLTGGATTPTWGQVNLAQATAVTGILPVVNGGTGASTLALNGVLFGNAASPVGVTAIGAEHQVLTVGASPFVPVFSSYLLSGTSGGKTDFAVTSGKTLTLTATDNSGITFTGACVLTIPAAGAVIAALLGTANVFAAANTFSVAPICSTLTAGRVVFAGASKELVDSSGLLFATATTRLTVSDAGVLPTISSGTSFVLNKSAGTAYVSGMSLVAGVTGVSYIYFGDSDDENAGYVYYDHTNDYLSFRTSGSGEDVRIDSAGNVGIGDVAPAEKLDVTGNVNSTGVYKVDDVQVISNRGAAVADATDAASVILRLNELLARVRTHGLIAT
jgi:hypothetical protein